MSFVASIFQVFWPQNQNSYYTKAPVDDWFGVVHFKYFLYQKRINIKITYIKNHNNYLTYFPFSLFPFSVFFFLPFLKSLDPISCDSIPWKLSLLLKNIFAIVHFTLAQSGLSWNIYKMLHFKLPSGRHSATACTFNLDCLIK